MIPKDEIDKNYLENRQGFNEWQLCPKCNGNGEILNNDFETELQGNIMIICDLCNGKKIISKITGEPPK